MLKTLEVALHVRVKFNDKFIPKCLGEEYLAKDEIIFISDRHIYNDPLGQYVRLKGYSPSKEEFYINFGYAYLNQLDLEFPINY